MYDDIMIFYSELYQGNFSKKVFFLKIKKRIKY